MFRVCTSWDDGNKLDLRVARMLLKYEVHGTFFVPTCGQLEPDEIQELGQMGLDIGGHTSTHPQDLKLLDDGELESEIEENKQWLEDILGEPIRDFCYPRGRYDERVIEAVKKAGYESARTTLILNTNKQNDKYRLKTTIHCCPIRPEYKGRDWLEVGKELFLKAQKEGGEFHLWGHSAEVEKYNEWNKLGATLEFIHNNLDLNIWKVR